MGAGDEVDAAGACFAFAQAGAQVFGTFAVDTIVTFHVHAVFSGLAALVAVGDPVALHLGEALEIGRAHV